MNINCLKKSFGFGIASGIITTLGLMVGLYSSTFSRGVVLAGILTIAVADSLSDGIGMHLAEETEGFHTHKDVWLVTIYTFLSKFIITISFLPLVLFLPLKIAIISNILWGIILIFLFSYFVAKKQNNNPLKASFEHSFLLIGVIVITYVVGRGIDRLFID